MTPNPVTVRELIALLEQCDLDAPVLFQGWQHVHKLTVCETWRTNNEDVTSPVITFEEIN